VSDNSHVSLIWYINSFVSLFLNGVHLVFDPINTQTFKRWLNMPAGWSRDCEGSPDVVLITHTHFDHFDPPYIIKLHKKSPLTLVIWEGSRKDKLDPSLTCHLIHEEDIFSVGPLEIRAFPCFHAMEQPIRIGNVPCVGYIIKGSRTICVLGDTLYLDFRPFLGDSKIDLLVFPAGGRTILSLFKTHLKDSESYRIIKELQPSHVVPVHWDSRKVIPFLLPEFNDVSGLKYRVEEELGISFHILERGGRLEL
jgi:L-ascorbate metabolism protein UlaG (beta-lactamase superfamily)